MYSLILSKPFFWSIALFTSSCLIPVNSVVLEEIGLFGFIKNWILSTIWLFLTFVAPNSIMSSNCGYKPVVSISNTTYSISLRFLSVGFTTPFIIGGKTSISTPYIGLTLEFLKFFIISGKDWTLYLSVIAKRECSQVSKTDFKLFTSIRPSNADILECKQNSTLFNSFWSTSISIFGSIFI